VHPFQALQGVDARCGERYLGTSCARSKCTTTVPTAAATCLVVAVAGCDEWRAGELCVPSGRSVRKEQIGRTSAATMESDAPIKGWLASRTYTPYTAARRCGSSTCAAGGHQLLSACDQSARWCHNPPQASVDLECAAVHQGRKPHVMNGGSGGERAVDGSVLLRRVALAR
jgi:hypothetical protein